MPRVFGGLTSKPLVLKAGAVFEKRPFAKLMLRQQLAYVDRRREGLLSLLLCGSSGIERISSVLHLPLLSNFETRFFWGSFKRRFTCRRYAMLTQSSQSSHFFSIPAIV